MKLFLLLGLLLGNLAFASGITLPSGYKSWKAPVANSAALPSSRNTAGDCRVAKDTSTIYCWSGSAWTASAGGGGTSNTVDDLNGFMEGPSDKTYTLIQKAPVAFTINALDIVTASGTTTAALKINGTNVTGASSVSVSSTPTTATATAANSVSPGDKVTMVLSSSSSPTDLAFTMKFTYASAPSVFGIFGFLEGPTDKTYTLVFKAPYAFTINSLDIVTASGTTTAAVKIGSTSVTGLSAVSVSSTPTTATATAANAVSVGDKVSIVLSSSASPVDLSFTLKYTR